ncbi:TRAP transporter small permease [Pelagibacterium halotolerans]|uniref:TRAP transporter small permease protein n=1 Tax=Pelagibacterium halotolerans (strain DSM 22347 / JCM 15775 / CGMCC 1.7692 / B2) TaxID=1082931 RepID=G4R789_PELHB|nr:TRAP transporter small permease subunit [Pelagibacterium halotolerans]AEQ51225.1 TRAP dicarboxylate transporter, DctQ subunit, unknown substrate 3 [Pelagibacterium halotolerans B2]QJR18912.1 TRAP transporter small permease [Pelagibacterium halotolerans]SEA67886.1 TRAP-type C4-dicarboxylate transport system, small permease component [Pelagibacterium halotolerans]
MTTTPIPLKIVDFIRTITKYWALLGGVFILGVVAINVYSIALIILFGRPFPGVYELVQIGAAVGMFMFLPYCQISGANVTADIFTSGMPKKAVAALSALGALLALALAVLLLWRMFFGLEDLIEYRETTTIHQIPLWYGYVPILVSLALVALAAFSNIVQARYGIIPEEIEGA